MKARIDSDLRQEQILNAVVHLLAEKGMTATTKELAQAAGVSEALIYKHFKSKQALFDKVKERCCNQVQKVAGDVFYIEPIAEQLAAAMLLISYTIIIGFEEDVIPTKETQKLIMRSLLLDGEFALQIFSNFEVWVEPISESMQRGIDEAVLKKSHLSLDKQLWMVHHFLMGMTMTQMPETVNDVFKLNEKELVKQTAIRSLLMIGMDSELAQQSINDVLKNQKQFEFIKNLQE